MKKLTLNVAPLILLAVVVVSSFRMVHSDSNDNLDSVTGAVDAPGPSAIATPVAPQAVVVEAKSSIAVSPPVPSASDGTPIEDRVVDELGVPPADVPPEKDRVWDEINEAIYGLNAIVGEELILSVKRQQKGQMDIRLDDALWKRVQYQTRVDLKTDISDLWHLYVREYASEGRSVVYFLDDSNDRVIDIFSKASPGSGN